MKESMILHLMVDFMNCNDFLTYGHESTVSLVVSISISSWINALSKNNPGNVIERHVKRKISGIFFSKDSLFSIPLNNLRFRR